MIVRYVLAAAAAAAVLAPGAPAAVRLTLSPDRPRFGDLVTASVAAAEGTRIAVAFAPFTVRSQESSVAHGRRVTRYVLQCLDPACLPGRGPRAVALPAARLRGGLQAWPRLVVLPRTTPREVGHPLRSFRRQTAVPPPDYRLSPATLRTILLAAATLLGLGAVVAAAPGVRRLLPERRDERTALERALDLVRSSLRRGDEDRRRALDLLARALGGGALARDALGLAWSETAPEATRVEALADAVERRT